MGVAKAPLSKANEASAEERGSEEHAVGEETLPRGAPLPAVHLPAGRQQSGYGIRTRFQILASGFHTRPSP
jgi:hypothetical protein